MSTASTSAPSGPVRGATGPLLQVEDLRVRFRTGSGLVNAVNGVSYTVTEGETLAILGESGSGKSVSAQAIMGILDMPPAEITSGQIVFEGRDLLTVSAEEQRKVRGPGISMIFQDALSSLNPVYSVGFQIGEMFRAHRGTSRKEAKQHAIELMDRVRIPAAAQRVNDYPHQFSGGMRQRVMIAMAMALNPDLLIADEPTTALDVTVQAQVLSVIRRLQEEFGTALILITHDLGVVAEMADDVLVMYAGRAVEYGSGKEILTHPEMPYTWGLLSSVPDVTGDTSAQLIPIPGNPPSLLHPPSGCHFHPRCAHRDKVPGDLCRTTLPELLPVNRGSAHLKRCHIADPDAVYRSEVLPEIAPDLVEDVK